MKKLILIFVIFIIGFLRVDFALAGDEACTEPGYGVCWPTRTINQWSCDHCVDGLYCSGLGISGGVCTQNDIDDPHVNDSCDSLPASQQPAGDCIWMCVTASGNIGDECKQTGSKTMGCDTSLNNCSAAGFSICTWSGGSCSETQQGYKSCCGLGDAPPEDSPNPSPGSSPSPSPSPSPGNITGSVYLLGEGAQTQFGGDGICSLISGGTATGEKPGGGSEVSVFFGGGGVMTQPVQGNGNFEIFDVPTGLGYMAGLTIGDPATWICACPLGCDYGSVVSSPMTGLDFFVTDQKDAWFQVEGGNLHANSGSVGSNIPSSALSPYLITEDAGLVSYTDSLELGEGDINESGVDWQAA